MWWLTVFALATSAQKDAPALRIAAAADMQRALSKLQPAIEKAVGRPLLVTYGSSGLLAQQLEQGAPFAVYLSANQEWSDKLVAKKACPPPAIPFAQGTLVLVAKAAEQPTLASLRSAKKIAVANPKLAPFGMAAMNALESLPDSKQLVSKLVFADNVSHALQLVDTGNAEVGLVSASLLDDARARLVLTHQVPLRLTALVCRPDGQALVDWLTSPSTLNERTSAGLTPVHP